MGILKVEKFKYDISLILYQYAKEIMVGEEGEKVLFIDESGECELGGYLSLDMDESDGRMVPKKEVLLMIGKEVDKRLKEDRRVYFSINMDEGWFQIDKKDKGHQLLECSLSPKGLLYWRYIFKED